MMIRPFRKGTGIAVAVLVAGPFTPGCQGPASGSRPSTTHDRTEIEFEDGTGADSYQFEAEDGGYELEDGHGADVAKYRREGDELLIEEARGIALGSVRMEGEDLVLVGGDGQVVYRASIEPDGDVRIRYHDAVLYKLKVRHNGYKIVDGAGNELGRVKVSETKVSIRDPEDETRLETRDPISGVAAGFLGLEKIPLELRAGMTAGALAFGFGG